GESGPSFLALMVKVDPSIQPDRAGGDQDKKQHAAEGEHVGPAPPPFAPALAQAAGGDLAEGLIVQMPAQIGREACCGGIAVCGGLRETLVDQVGQLQTDGRIAMMEWRESATGRPLC